MECQSSEASLKFAQVNYQHPYRLVITEFELVKKSFSPRSASIHVLDVKKKKYIVNLSLCFGFKVFCHRKLSAILTIVFVS